MGGVKVKEFCEILHPGTISTRRLLTPPFEMLVSRDGPLRRGSEEAASHRVLPVLRRADEEAASIVARVESRLSQSDDGQCQLSQGHEDQARPGTSATQDMTPRATEVCITTRMTTGFFRPHGQGDGELWLSHGNREIFRVIRMSQIDRSLREAAKPMTVATHHARTSILHPLLRSLLPDRLRTQNASAVAGAMAER
jgi:hypothetical protein